MKQCPSCRTTYTDETLSFCLADGTPLTEIAEEVTFVRSGRSDPMRVEIPQVVVPPPSYIQSNALPEKGSNTMRIMLVVGLLGAMAVVAVGGAAALIYFNKDSRTAEPVANSKGTPTPTATSTPDNTNELRDQIANIEKRLNEQKNTNKNPATQPLVMPSQSTTRISATVNSPGDGFLALRSLPKSEAGERIIKIPHGANISIGGCRPVVRPVSRSGRWCQASYNGYTGWVFDAYLVY